MKYKSKHYTIEEQIKILKEININVDDETILEKVNYSHLIYKFGKHYLQEGEQILYKDGTKLSHIYIIFIYSI